MKLPLTILITLLLYHMTAAQKKIPQAQKIPHSITHHGDTRVDNYYWLNQYWLDGPQKEEVIHYLQEENTYAEEALSSTKELQEKLFQEFLDRIKKTDESVPYFENGYWYITKVEDEKEYLIYVRKKESLEAPEELLLDVNQMAEGHEYFQAAGMRVSPDNKILAYSVDSQSRRIYTTYFKNLDTGEILPDTLTHTSANLEWAADSKTVFFSTQDEKTLRNDKIWKYTLGDHESRKLIFHEEDDTFYTYIDKTKSNRFILIVSESTLSTEVQLIKADEPDAGFKTFQEREKDHLYQVFDSDENFYILTNWNAPNYRLMSVPIKQSTTKENWRDIIPHREQVLLEDIEVFSEHLVLSEVKNANTHLRVIPWNQADKEYYIPFSADAYVAGLAYNPEYNTNLLRFYYQSMVTPPSQYDINMDTQEQKLLKQQEVLGGFNESDYITERLWATARDGQKVPISIVYHKSFQKDASHPLLLYGYGSYGHSMEPLFSFARISLLNRGFAYAIAHIRGGEEMGRSWYLNGKMFDKINTFTDFIDCADFLVEQKYTQSKHLYAQGGSAGGLLMGAVANMRPELWNGMISDVPFVDVLTTMLDESIPLTTGEYDEWGNPHHEESYHYIKSYSPYDNIQAKDYPNMMINTGLHDSQVQYFEPAKYVAKLRELKTDDNLLILNCDMNTGHGGQSGRFQRLKEIARDYAFIFMLEQIND